MSTHPFRSVPAALAAPTVPPAGADEAESFYERLTATYALAEDNPHVFASPLGPFGHEGEHVWLPRFVFFGPGTTDASWRLAFLAGFDAGDLRASRALLGLLHFLGGHASEGHGLNLTFFPIVDVAGHLFGTPDRGLGQAHWPSAAAPEIALLERDARAAGYHGYIRVEPGAPEDEIIVARVRSAPSTFTCPDVELIESGDFAPFAVRFERASAPGDGPLSIADDLPVSPFELTLRIPRAWSHELYQTAVNLVLSRFVLRYRAFQAFGGHL